jgi:hypothetical protein
MRQPIVFIYAVFILMFACNSSSKWQKSDIENKLRIVFPNARAIRVLDSVDFIRIKSDTLDLPSPIYKGLITEGDYPNYSFIFYFYNASLKDTSSFVKVFRAVMIHDLTAALGTKKVQYVCGMPQFDKTGDKLILYTVLLSLPKNYDVLKKEIEIRKVFDLQKVKLKDVKLSRPE